MRAVAQEHDFVEAREGAVGVVAFLVGVVDLLGARAFADDLERAVEPCELCRVLGDQFVGAERRFPRSGRVKTVFGRGFGVCRRVDSFVLIGSRARARGVFF
ncbi:MAG: hypothetical protein LBC59_07770 [Chitinispirillales bacterium]|nr:hypothetical protein [Chitinispirillales bacterium]